MSETFHFYSFIHIMLSLESNLGHIDGRHYCSTSYLFIYLFICDYPFALNTYYNESNQDIQNLKVKKVSRSCGGS